MLPLHRDFRLIAVCLTLLIYSNLATAADNGWIEVRGLHFRVLSDGGDKDARRLARGPAFGNHFFCKGHGAYFGNT